MSTSQPVPKYRLYPAYCFRASPTYNAWVKLTAADVQALRSEPDFQGQHIYFYLNHPIRFVRLVGVIVAIEDINVKYTALTLDDGSGATIEVTVVRLTPDDSDASKTPSNTTIDNVNIISEFGVFEVMVDRRCLGVGTVIKAKGTLAEFRGAKKVELKRVWIVSTTNEEAQAWAETAEFKSKVLSKPWRIRSAEHAKVKADIKADKQSKREYLTLKYEHEQKKREHRKARMEYMAEREVKLELRRRKEERELNKGALI